MIGLATRLTAGGGREAAVRLALTALGLALATAMLLFATVAFPALQAHDERRGWMDTSRNNQQPAQDEATTDPLLWRTTETRFDGRDLLRVDVAALGPDAPVPPGLDALPGAGELAVSPALRELLADTDSAMLADRLPGEVTATVGRDALVSPEDLVVFVGRAGDELRSEPEVQTVRSIEGAPFTRNLTRLMRVAVFGGGIGLLAPVMVFVATATRLGAARRERRLAAMRLAGATPRQVGLIAAVEAALAAVLGTAAGFGLLFALRPSLADIPFDGATFYPSDLRLSWGWAVAVALGVPLLAVGTAVVSLRRAQISPLGVVRRAVRSRPSARPLVLVPIGLAGLVGQTAATNTADVVVALAVAIALLVMIAGIALSGAWLTATVGRGLARVGRRAPSLLAARRLQDNPTAGFRTIGGLILAVFVGTVFSSFTASILANNAESTDDTVAPGVVAAVLSPDLPPAPPQEQRASSERAMRAQVFEATEWPELASGQAEQIQGDLAAVDGVRHVATAYVLPDEVVRTRVVESEITFNGEPLAMGCSDVAALGLPACDRAEGTTVVMVTGDGIEATGLEVTDVVPLGALDELQPVGFAAATDGTTTAIEQARTLLERGLPAGVAQTQADIDAENQATARTTQRISNIALAVTMVIAGCSLAIAVAGSIVERRQPFALMRLAGTRLSDLRRIVLTEAAAPLLMVATVTTGLGLAVTALYLQTASEAPPFALPGTGYWLALVGGVAVALGVVVATLPLLNRLTSPETVRFE